MAVPVSYVCSPKKAIPEHQQIDPHVGRHCPYMNASQPQNAISEK